MIFKKKFNSAHYKALLVVGALVLLAAAIMIQSKEKEQNIVQYKTQKVEDTSNLLNENWQYMVGMTKTEQGYEVRPINRVIVEQDGAIAQKNPPINLAGTFIEKITGDFVIIADVDLQKSNSATMQLYGNVPIIADEFKIERESLSIAITPNTLVVKVWDGEKQQPIEVREFPYKQATEITLGIARTKQAISFAVNNETVGEIQDPGLFDKNKLWFGFAAENEPWLLKSLRIDEKNAGSFVIADGSTIKVQQNKEDSLQKLAQTKRPNFIIGGAMALGPLVSDNEYAQVALSEFNSVTPENEMKMINLQPTQGVHTFAQADALVHIAKQNGLSVHGHALVFGEANPSWFNALPTTTSSDKQAIKTIMVDHIQKVVGHYKNDVHSWDVINEPLADYDQFEDGQILRNHKWYQAMGEEYIITALETAHRANPEAMLFINEYGLEAEDDRWDAMYALLQRIKPQLAARGIPIEKVGVGFQSHIYERGDRIDPASLRKHIKQLEELGYKAQISELDVYSGDGDAIQSDQYTQVLRACLEEKNCIAWRIWIIADRYNYWKNDQGQILQGKDGLYDVLMQPRPAYNSLIRTLK